MIIAPLNLRAIKITPEQFLQICLDNPDAFLELTKDGELIEMSPVGGESSRCNGKLYFHVEMWNNQKKLGVVYESSCGFELPLGGILSPDVSWISLEKWQGLTEKQRKKFLPLCPDFVIELRADSDKIKPLQEKMQQYIDNGCRLGWLINPQNQQVEIYRPNQQKEVMENPTQLFGEQVLPDFVLDLTEIFSY